MDKKPYPSELQDRFIVRMPSGMRDQIAEAAKANNRSMNAEIVSRLQQSLDKGYIPSPGTWGNVDDDGNVTFRGAQELLDELADLTGRAASIVALFQDAQHNPVKFERTVLVKHLGSTATPSKLEKTIENAVESAGKPHTPKIPGTNTPKRSSKRKP